MIFVLVEKNFMTQNSCRNPLNQLEHRMNIIDSREREMKNLNCKFMGISLVIDLSQLFSLFEAR